MLQYDFHNSLGYWILSTARLYERAMQQELLPQGITHRQSQVLGWLVFAGDMPQVDLADKMGIEPPTLVRILDRMERDGLVTREACPDDRRKKIVRLSPNAAPIWKTIVRCAKAVRSRAARGFSDQQREVLRRLLEMVQANLADAASERLVLEDGDAETPAPQPRLRARPPVKK